MSMNWYMSIYKLLFSLWLNLCADQWVVMLLFAWGSFSIWGSVPYLWVYIQGAGGSCVEHLLEKCVLVEETECL